MTREEIKSQLDNKWPGLDKVLVGMISELESQLRDPWVAEKIKAEGPDRFKNSVARILQKQLADVDHSTLVKLAAYLLAPILLQAMSDVGESLAKKGDPCK